MRSQFQVKLCNILNNPSNKEIIEWFKDGLIIYDIARLESEILIHNFKHSQYASFLRQLNIYGFLQRERQTKNCAYFAHEEIEKIRNKQIFIKRKQQFKIDLIALKSIKIEETENLFQQYKVITENQQKLQKQFHLCVQLYVHLQNTIANLKKKQEYFITEYNQSFKKYENFSRIVASNSMGYMVLRQQNVQRIVFSDQVEEIVTPFLTPKPFYALDDLIQSLFSLKKM